MTSSPSALPPTPKFWVNHDGVTQGPFDQEFIEAMVMAHVYPASVLVCKVRNKEWIPFHRISNRNAVVSDQSQPELTVQPNLSKKKSKRANSTNPIFLVILGLFIIGFVGWIYSQARSSAKTVKAPHDTTQFTTTEKTHVNAGYQPQSTNREEKPTASKSASINLPSDYGQVVRDASGRTYRVPDAAYNRLVSLKNALDVKNMQIDAENRAFESMASLVERERQYLDTTSEYAVDAFNRRVNNLNAKNQQLQNLVDDYNRDVQAFNYELERVGTLIR